MAVQVWEAATGEARLRYHGHSAPVEGLTWSPDSKQIASASEDKTVQVWEATTGHLLRRYQGHTGGARRVAWSPDGTYIASTGWGSPPIHIWEVTTGHLLWHYGHGHLGHSLAWSPDGKYLLSCTFAGITFPRWQVPIGMMEVREVSTGRQIFTFESEVCSLHAVAWSPVGGRLRRFALGDHQGSVFVWDGAGNTWRYQDAEKDKQSAQFGCVNSLAFSPDGVYLAAGFKSGIVKIWNVQHAAFAFTYHGHEHLFEHLIGQKSPESINAIAWSPDGNYIASACDDQTVHVWQAR